MATDEFVITLTGKPPTYAIEVATRGQRFGTFPFVLALNMAEQVTLEELQHNQHPTDSALRGLGATLYRALFPPEVALLLATARERTTTGKPLRLKLNIYPPELAQYPWEFLYVEEECRFWITQQTSPLVRYVSPRRYHSALPPQKHVKPCLLYVAAQPVEAVLLEIQASLEAIKSEAQSVLELDFLPNASPATLRAKLERPPYADMLHFDGHGVVMQNTGEAESSFIALEAPETARGILVSPTDFADWLANTKIRVVVLAACATAESSAANRFVGFAQALIRATPTLEAVVAMQFPISDRAAIHFNRSLYSKLREGQPIDQAVTAARLALKDEQEQFSTAWGAPVLFLQQPYAFYIHRTDDTFAPYKGLKSYQFTSEDARLFAGREGRVKDLHTALKAKGFLVVTGVSGSGKSSLVQAGLLPTWSRQPDTQAWHIVSFQLGDQPYQALAQAFAEAKPPLPSDHPLPRSSDLTPRTGLRDYLQRLPVGTRLLLVIDQFENLFAGVDAAQTATVSNEFISALLMAHSDLPNTSFALVLTIRTDALNKLGSYFQVDQRLPDHLFYVSGMNKEELRRAITLPATAYGLEFEEDELTEQIIAETLTPNEPDNKGGRLPLLSFALLQTWQGRDGRTLTRKAYDDSGGVEGAIANCAKEVYKQWTAQPDYQSVARTLLLELLHIGKEQSATRRRRPPKELLDLFPDNRTDAFKVLSALISARLLTSSGALLSADAPSAAQASLSKRDTAFVEIAHDALIREWSELRGWIEAERADRLKREYWEAIHDRWQEAIAARRPEADYLLQDAPLDELTAWQTQMEAKHSALVTAPIRALLAASQAAKAQRAAEAERQREKEQAARAQRAAEAERQREKERVAQRNFRAVRLALASLGVSVLTVLLALWLTPIVMRELTARTTAKADILGGEALLGAGQGQPVTLPAFRVDVYEVTIEAYCTCNRFGPCEAPITGAFNCNQVPSVASVKGRLPVGDVTLERAQTYCTWVGGTLPTYAQWERVVRGTGGRAFPWDNPALDPPPVRMSSPELRSPGLVSVDDPIYALGATSDSGVWHLFGNVAEWTLTPEACEDDPYSPACLTPDTAAALPLGNVLVVGGASVDRAPLPAPDVAWRTGEYRFPHLGTDAVADIGFRCVYP